MGDVGGPRFAAHEGREHQHQLARRRTDLPKAPLEKNRISYLDVWERSYDYSHLCICENLVLNKCPKHVNEYLTPV